MDSQMSKAKGITEEEFRSCFPDVSIQSLSDRSSKVIPNVEKKHPVKTVPVKTPVMSKAQAPVKPLTSAKSTNLTPVHKTPQRSCVKSNVAPTKINSPVAAKTQIATKNPPPLTKSPVMTKSPIPTKTPVSNKTITPAKIPIPTTPVAKTHTTTVKGSAIKTTPANLPKTPQQKNTPIKTPQNVKQQTANLVKTTVKPTATMTATSTPVVKEDIPDQSTMTVLTYHMPQTTQQRTSKQLTIEKIEQQQRIPVVIDNSNHVVLRQVVNSGQLVLQNRVAPAEATLQSVVIGTTAQPVSPGVAPIPQVEITSSEPLQALQVTQQVTLFRPKGTTFTVEDVKKQINLNKQNTMTNVVSSTTNSTPTPLTIPAQSAQPETKKVVLPARVQGTLQSPVRQSVRAQTKSANVRSYQSTKGQVKKVSPKREIPMQKVLPLPPPAIPPPPELQLGNEEEVTTSEDMPQERPSGTQLIVILPTGEKKTISIADNYQDYTIQDLLKTVDAQTSENMQGTLTTRAIVSGIETENFQDIDNNEAHWENEENIGPEPGEILGMQDEEAAELMIQSEADGANKDHTNVNIEPLFREGLLAVCKFCGLTSNNFRQCQRCKRAIPSNCKTIPADFTQKSRKTKADSLTNDSPKKKKVCRKRRMEEPVCLTISDDEELLGLAHHSRMQEESFHSDSNSQMSSCDKEPVITDEMITEMKQSVSGGGLDMEELLDNPDPNEKTYLQCRTVRIGSYKVVPRDKVLITPHGLKVTVPVLNSDQYVELRIMYHEIIRVLIHFGRQMPVLFFYTKPCAAAKIRKALNMEDKNGFYYDCLSTDETHRRITFLPDKIDDECKQTLKTIFGDPENNVFAELTGKEANDILVKASPKEVQAFILKKQPNNQQQQQQQQQPFNGQNIQTIMVYPPPPEKGGIPINTEDYACLGEDQFLNDVIIDFYLKYVVEKTLSPEDRARTHVFSSFFYKRLTTKPPAKRKSMNPVENDPAASPAAKRHSRVKSWTKNVNLFTKDFIVIPINENSHWFLAIICFPGLTGPVRFSDNTPIELAGRKKRKIDGKHTVTIGSTTITAVAKTHTPTLDVGDDVEDRDEADGDDEDMDVPDLDEEPVQKTVIKEEPDEDQTRVTRKKQREPIKQPCILIFDSLAGASRSRVVATLRDYLRVEYEAKHGEVRDFSGDVMKGTNLRCPQQTNYTDCGLYVLQYVEAFFQWPVTDYHIPITQLQDWFQADIVSRKRYEIQQLLHRLMQEQSIDIEALNLPLLNLRPEGKHLVEYSGSEEEDEDDEDDEDQMCEDEEEDMLDDEGDFNDEIDHENEIMEEGEIGHPDDDDPGYLDPSLHHGDHEMDVEDYQLEDDEEIPEEEEDDDEEEIEKELEDISRTPGPVKRDLKDYRIPRLITRDNVTEKT